MTELLNRILKSYGQDYDSEFLEANRDKIINYIELLASTGNRDPRKLAAYGRSYLRELQSPDPRYTGC